MMTDSSGNLTVWIDTTGERPVIIGCRDREVSNPRVVLAHLTKEDALKLCHYIETGLKDPDCTKTFIDSMYNADILMGSRAIWIGELYRHFTGRIYQVISFARHSETNEMMVIYQDQLDKCSVIAQPFEIFASEIDHAKYPDMKQKYQFEQITDE